jgi:hypothetical protein
MIKGFIDEYEDESGVDVVNSINQYYNSVDDYYTTEDVVTKLLLHLDNNVTDVKGKTITNNNVTFSDSIYKFGTHSAYFNGSDAYLSLADSNDWDFDADFTIDFWIWPQSGDRWNYVVGSASQASGSDGWYWFYNINGVAAFSAMFSGSWLISINYTHGLAVSQWNHIAIVREGSTCRVFTNGVYKGSDTSASGAVTSSYPVWIGTSPAGDPYPFLGYIDEFRISKGIARWLGSSSFTPPANPYGFGEMTLLSNARVADDVPTSARIVLFEEDVDVITLNTDIKAYISRDNGVTYSQVTLEDEGNYITLARVLSGSVDISAQPSDTDVKYKIETLNNKNLKLHGTAVSWR